MSSTTADKSTFTFQHPLLGALTGLIQPDNVVQFRAVPYATIPARFKRSVPLDALPPGEHNHTEHGFACPQIFPPGDADGGPFPNEPATNSADEFACLILQLNIPLQALQNASQKLPVLVYIHGGGFVLGKIDEQHSTALMAQQSVSDKQPVIAASFQYRLGALGYLHVPGGSSNLALHDQRNALLWIRRFIDGFGGDAARVTVFGESAGGMSICLHMLAAPPPGGALFSRAILMSGVVGPVTAPCLKDEAERRYDAFLTRLGIEERGEEGLEKLSEMDVERLVAVSAEMNEQEMWLCVRDEEWFGEDAEKVTWDRIPELMGKCEWVNDIVVGCTSFEGTTVASRFADVTPAAFLTSIEKQLGAESGRIVSKAYSVTPTMDQNLFLTALMRWIGDVLFDAPSHMLATHLSTQTNKTIHRYIFDVRNPFPNHALYQQPHHWVDVYFIFKAHQFRFPSQRLKDISTKHAQLWIEFANGKKPWGEYVYTGKEDEVVMVADEREGWVERRVREVERDLEWGWGRCEKLVRSWEGVKGVGFGAVDLECLAGVKRT